MNWAGGDPLLNTFIYYPEGELARLIFHELAHQVVYAKDDTMFNESFATAVERLGGARWLATQASEAARQEYAAVRRPAQPVPRAGAGDPERLEQIYEDTQGAERDGLKQADAQAVPRAVCAAARELGRRPGALARLRPLGGAGQQRVVRRAGRLRRTGARLRSAVRARGPRLEAVL